MTGLGRSLFYAAFGAVAGGAGLAASRCGTGSCGTCLACVAPSAGVVLLAVLGKLPHRRKAEIAAPSGTPAVALTPLLPPREASPSR